MFAWGSDLLVVDFGSNGLWKYDGSWTKLSYLDPVGIIALSDSHTGSEFGFPLTLEIGNMTDVRGSRLPLAV